MKMARLSRKEIVKRNEKILDIILEKKVSISEAASIFIEESESVKITKNSIAGSFRRFINKYKTINYEKYIVYKKTIDNISSNNKSNAGVSKSKFTDDERKEIAVFGMEDYIKNKSVNETLKKYKCSKDTIFNCINKYGIFRSELYNEYRETVKKSKNAILEFARNKQSVIVNETNIIYEKIITEYINSDYFQFKQFLHENYPESNEDLYYNVCGYIFRKGKDDEFELSLQFRNHKDNLINKVISEFIDSEYKSLLRFAKDKYPRIKYSTLVYKINLDKSSELYKKYEEKSRKR